MSHEIIIPQDLWEEDIEGVITTWFVSDGASIDEGDVIAEVMVQKIQHEVLAPASGTLSIGKEADDTVSKGDQIGTIA